MLACFVNWLHALVSSNDSESYQAALKKDVHLLTGELWNLILPHVILLSTHAENYGQKHSSDTSSLSDQSIWLDVFESTAESVIQKTLRLRTRLAGTNCEFRFLWPSPGAIFDLPTMQTTAGVALNADPMAERKVAFTTFPGLEVTTTEFGVTSTSVAYKAMVKLYPHFG